MARKAPYMSKTEFSRALALALTDIPKELGEFMKSIKFDGFGLAGFEPVTCSLFEMAQLIAYQTFTFAGTIDEEAMAEIWRCRRKFLIVGDGSDEVVQRQHDRIMALDMIDAVCA